MAIDNDLAGKANTTTIDLLWQGPFSWPGASVDTSKDAGKNATFLKKCGIYLWTIEYKPGFLIYTAGVTSRSFACRFREHTKSFHSGIYTIFDAYALQNGARKIIWPGFWYKKRPVALEQVYSSQQNEITLATKELLATYRIFIAPLSPEPRIFARIEAAIMYQLYSAPEPISLVPDRGMSLAPRWPTESVIYVRNLSEAILHGLPKQFAV